MKLAFGVILGTLPSMKNSRKLVVNRRTRRPMLIKSDKARQYVQNALRQISGNGKPITDEVAIYATVIYPNRRHDLDIELLCDVLQAAGVIKNDRLIVEKHSVKVINKADPKVIWEVHSV